MAKPRSLQVWPPWRSLKRGAGFGLQRPPPDPLIYKTFFLLYTSPAQRLGFLMVEEAAVVWFSKEILG